ncbi:MAG: VWA domain-containing protein [Candidatus Schekmanbacteria bacterium]|nr:VWA domain-containing protein [Candidatus Schekmanbacteria bacterium]
MRQKGMNLEELRFDSPYFLLLIVFVPFMVWNYTRDNEKKGIPFSSIELLKEFNRPGKITPGLVKLLLRSLLIIIIAAALARPQLGTYSTEVESEGVDIMLVLDTSGSMSANDFSMGGSRVTRLEAVKRVVRDFVEGREGDRIGMIVFGEEAYTQCPITLDYAMLLYYLEKLEVGVAGDVTAIGTALALGAKRMKDLPGNSKLMILLTDGRNNFGRVTPSMAADIAASYGIKVYTIGVGRKGEAPQMMNSEYGETLLYSQVDLDEPSLKNIASVTGGMYFNAKDTRSLSEIYKRINSMEKIKFKVKTYFKSREIYQYFLMAGLFVLISEIIIMNTLYKVIP